MWVLLATALYAGGGGRTTILLTFPDRAACEKGYLAVLPVLKPAGSELRPDIFGSIRHACIPGVVSVVNRAN